MSKFFISDDILQTLTNWVNLLKNLSLSENFVGYEWEGEIEPGEIKKITGSIAEKIKTVTGKVETAVSWQ